MGTEDVLEGVVSYYFIVLLRKSGTVIESDLFNSCNDFATWDLYSFWPLQTAYTTPLTVKVFVEGDTNGNDIIAPTGGLYVSRGNDSILSCSVAPDILKFLEDGYVYNGVNYFGTAV